MLALAERAARPRHAPAGTSSCCTALSRRRPAHRASPSVSLTIFQRGGPGAMRGADGYDALGFTGTPGSACARPTWRCSSSPRRTSCDYYEYLPDSAGAGRVARRLRHAARAGASTARASCGVTIGDDAAAEGADPAPGLFGGEPAGLNELRLHFPTAPCATGAPRRSSTTSRRARSATRIATAAAPATATRGAATRELVLAEVRDGLLSAGAARGRATASPSLDDGTGDRRGRDRRGCAAGHAHELPTSGSTSAGRSPTSSCSAATASGSSTRRARRPTTRRVGFVTRAGRDRRAARARRSRRSCRRST